MARDARRYISLHGLRCDNLMVHPDLPGILHFADGPPLFVFLWHPADQDPGDADCTPPAAVDEAAQACHGALGDLDQLFRSMGAVVVARNGGFATLGRFSLGPGPGAGELAQ